MLGYGEIGIIMFRMALMSESALDIVRSKTPPNYYNDFEHAVFTKSCIYPYFFSFLIYISYILLGLIQRVSIVWLSEH